MQVITNLLIPDHVGSMDDVGMRVHRHPDHDWITETLLGGFDNWDSEYYIYIAQHGYTFLQSMAFFPLYPMLMWLVGRVALFPLNFLLASRSLFLIAGSILPPPSNILSSKIKAELALCHFKNCLCLCSAVHSCDLAIYSLSNV